MASPTSEGPLEELLTPVVTQLGLRLDPIIRSRSNTTPLLRVIVKTPIGADRIDLDTLTEVSRTVSRTLDTVDPVDDEYLLEVSAPGAERELAKVGHWMRQIGRLVRTKLRADGYASGRVVAADEISVTIDVDGETTTIDYQDMRKARSHVDSESGD